MGPLSKSPNHEVVAVLLNGHLKKGLKRKWNYLSESRLSGDNSPIALARKQSVPILWLADGGEAAVAALRNLDIDLLITSGFGLILKRPLLDFPNIGCMNVHSSLLPRHRGPSPFPHVILSGDKESGVTFHVTDEGIDTGDILKQDRFSVDSGDNALSIYLKSCALTKKHILEVVDSIAKNGLKGDAQPTEGATYERKIPQEALYIDWTQPAESIERLYRAANPFMNLRFRYNDDDVTVMRASYSPDAVDAAPGEVISVRPLRVATGEGSLSIHVATSKRPVPFVWPAPWTPLTIGDTLH